MSDVLPSGLFLALMPPYTNAIPLSLRSGFHYVYFRKVQSLLQCCCKCIFLVLSLAIERNSIIVIVNDALVAHVLAGTKWCPSRSSLVCLEPLSAASQSGLSTASTVPKIILYKKCLTFRPGRSPRTTGMHFFVNKSGPTNRYITQRPHQPVGHCWLYCCNSYHISGNYETTTTRQVSQVTPRWVG